MRAELTIQKAKILIIDDDADLLDLLQDFLQSSGFEVKTNQSSGGIFQTITQYQPDLIILDYLLNLNGINGGELCHQVKTTTHIPVILYSAYPRVLLSLGTYGCDQFIPKPFDLDFFLESVRWFTKIGPNLISSVQPSLTKAQSVH
jgi:DNA-binding response OmpR family regulator